MSQIAVFWLHLRFWLFPKHRKNQCFDWILVLAEEKTSQITLFCSWWEQKTLYITMFYARCDILGAVPVGQKKWSFPAPQGLPVGQKRWSFPAPQGLAVGQKRWSFPAPQGLPEKMIISCPTGNYLTWRRRRRRQQQQNTYTNRNYDLVPGSIAGFAKPINNDRHLSPGICPLCAGKRNTWKWRDPQHPGSPTFPTLPKVLGSRLKEPAGSTALRS